MARKTRDVAFVTALQPSGLQKRGRFMPVEAAMTKTKTEQPKAAELTESDLDRAQGGTTRSDPTTPGKRSEPVETVRPFVVDGPYS